MEIESFPGGFPTFRIYGTGGHLGVDLWENGKLIIQGLYIEKGSKSFEVAKNLVLEKGLVEEYLVDELRKAGFKEIVSTIVDEAVWAENPYDRIPVTGDIQKFCIIQAKK